MAGRTLRSAPSLLGLYAKAALGSLPLVGRSSPDGDDQLEDLRLRLDDVEVSADRVDHYRSVCGFAPRGDLPATYPHVLAFPLHLALLTDPRFPFPAIGAVHIANTVTQHRPLAASDRLSFDVRTTDLRPHPRGRRVTLVTTCTVDGSLVWESETVLLHREPSTGDAPTTQTPVLPEQAPTGPLVWRLPSGLGRRYASVSGDRNPIHLYDVTAMPLGFKHHIAHGMWTKARCLAELSNRLPDAFTASVAFKKPVNLPSSVRFGARSHDAAIDFGLTSTPTPATHLIGRVVSL